MLFKESVNTNACFEAGRNAAARKGRDEMLKRVAKEEGEMLALKVCSARLGEMLLFEGRSKICSCSKKK